MNRKKQIDSEWKTFEDMKAYSKEVARVAFKEQLNDSQIKERFFDIFLPSSRIEYCRKLALAYRDYKNSRITIEEAEEITAFCERKWHNISGALKELRAWQEAARTAFETANLEYGTVEFTCPKCGGNSHYARYHTPDNIAHEITVRGYCDGCKFRMMN